MVMGTAGLSMSWHRAHAVLGTPEVIATALFWLAAITFVLVLTAYLGRIFIAPGALKVDMLHPFKSTFLATTTISLLLLATAGSTILPLGLVTVIWWIAAIANLAAMVVTMRVWMRPQIGLAHVTPAWFIPVVGNVIVPLTGVKLGDAAVSMSLFSFSVGIIMWLGILPIVLYRLFLHDTPMPPKFLPTIMILIAPPSVGAASLALLSGDSSFMPKALLSTAGAFLLIAATRIPDLMKLPFALPHWAMSFPLAAMASATLMFSETMGVVLLAVATALIAWLWVRTIVAIARGGIFVAD